MDREYRNRIKKQKIQEQLADMEQSLRNAQEYVARNVNVVGHCFLHLDDWNGKSGHPLWMKNYMIPQTERAQTHKEKALERIAARERERKHQKR